MVRSAPAGTGVGSRRLLVNPLRLVVAAVCIAAPVAVALALVGAPPAPAPAPSRARPVEVKAEKPKAPAIIGLDLDEALATHTKLMAAAQQVHVSQALPVPTPHSAGRIAADTERAAPTAAKSDVPDSRKIAVFFTGNVIGETDPCG